MSIRQCKRYLIFGGTGSLGTTLTRRLLQQGSIVGIFSRDEAKNFRHKQLFNQPQEQHRLRYYLGDVRNYVSVYDAIKKFRPDVIISAAAMKQVPLCEEFPEEAVQTNVIGTQNVAKAVVEFAQGSDQLLKMLSISTDKAVKPVNAYGCTKALQERIHLSYDQLNVMANCVRYGNVLESTGSVVPVFKSQLAQGRNLTVTSPEMTRFLLSLDEAVDLIFKALDHVSGGQIFVPKLRSAYIDDVAAAMCEAHGLGSSSITYTGVRPGEKLDELLISEEECRHVRYHAQQQYFVIGQSGDNIWNESDFSSGDEVNLISKAEVSDFLHAKGVFDHATMPAA